MTTAIKPESGLDWTIEIPECVSKVDPELSVAHFNSVLYNMALAGRLGFKNIPSNLPVDEQALLAFYRNIKDELKRRPEVKNLHTETEASDMYCKDIGRMLFIHARIGITNPQVGHFIGNGSKNDEDAERWQHSGH